MIIALIIAIGVLLLFMRMYPSIATHTCDHYDVPPESFDSYPQYGHTEQPEPFGSYLPAAEIPMKIGEYPTSRPSALTDTQPQLETERNGISITNGKANRVLWGYDSGVKAGSQKYPKFPTARGNLEYSNDNTLEDNIVYATGHSADATVLLEYPNTPDEFVNHAFELPNKLSAIAPPTIVVEDDSEYKKYISGVVNIDDTDGRIATSNLNRGFRMIQSRALSAQSTVEKYRPFYEQQLRERSCWMNADDPIM